MLLTLDSCVVFAALRREVCHDLASIDQLFASADEGRISLQLTEAFRKDLSRDMGDGEASAARDGRLAELPVLSKTVGGVFRLNVSLLSSNDVLSDEIFGSLNLKLIKLLRPKGADSNPSKAFSDIDHLLAHAISGADVFVTVDERTILNRQRALWGLNLRVLRPVEALRWAARC
jgi:hypothetical protein